MILIKKQSFPKVNTQHGCQRFTDTSAPGHFGPETLRHWCRSVRRTVRHRCRSVRTLRHRCRKIIL